MGLSGWEKEMTTEEMKAFVATFVEQCQTANDISKAASKGKKSLAGDNFYGNKFHNVLVELSKLKAKLKKLVIIAQLDKELIDDLFASLEIIESTNSYIPRRTEAIKRIKMISESELLPRLDGVMADPIPTTEQVLPMKVIQGTRPYIEKVVLQANGAYEHQWYDACAVMIRRLAETLIIELYESKSRQSEIQDGDGNYLMLSKLVDKIINDKSWGLARETKQALPLLKSLGDRSAHNRHYNAEKSDIDKVIHGLRVAVPNFLYLAGLK
jgi:Domain of unknown function (DUF4145)